MDQHDAPLFNALLRHVEKYRGYFHVPGHKQGMFFDEDGRPFFQKLLTLDLTEVGDLDDLHQPSGVILEAQQLAASAFGATQTWFLVGGSTVGNLAMIMAACKPGDEIVIQRNSHKSVFNGCILAGVRPVYLQPELDEQLGVFTGVSVQKLRTVLRRHPNVKAVVLTNPNYYGVVQPISDLAALCEEYGVPLLVDEAHGSHFSVHSDLPDSAITCGAAAVVQSTHKMLPAMTMGAMLHAHGTPAFREKLQAVLSMVQSSSPSYPLMASLDLARKYFATRAPLDVEQSGPVLRTLREAINARAEWRAFSPGDPYKMVLQRYGWSGYDIETGLAAEGVTLELADMRNGLAAFALGTGERECELLLKAVDQWSTRALKPVHRVDAAPPLHLSDTAVDAPLSELMRRCGEWISLEQAAGRVAKRMVLPYPPGIPAILPGETYTRRSIGDLQSLLKYGARFQGVKGDPTSNVWVEVIK